jgi:hypothetical protein
MSLLGHLPYELGGTTRMISPENPTGEKGKACLWEPNPSDPFLEHSDAALDLGKGYKVRPFINVRSGETAVLADIKGMGIINYFFITSSLENYSELVLRIYWDDEENPSVECPLGAFFAMGHDSQPHLVNSVPIVVAPKKGCTSYWQMPFREGAKCTLTNDGPIDSFIVAYKIQYKLKEVPKDVGYFHAQYRKTVTSIDDPNYVIVDGIKGKGSYVGTYLAWNALSSNWWGEGEVKFYLDGDSKYPTMADTGTEDYFGGAWGFSHMDTSDNQTFQNNEQAFSYPYVGMPLAKIVNDRAPRKYSLYRWHLLDSIGFEKDLKVTVQTLGWYPNFPKYKRYKPLSEDIASVAYWYQQEPHQPFPELPDLKVRWDR